MLESGPADHLFQQKTASPALKAAMADLAQNSGRSIEALEGMSMGEAHALALRTYGDRLPEFWVIWQSWNSSSDEGPAEMGDL